MRFQRKTLYVRKSPCLYCWLLTLLAENTNASGPHVRHRYQHFKKRLDPEFYLGFFAVDNQNLAAAHLLGDPGSDAAVPVVAVVNTSGNETANAESNGTENASESVETESIWVQGDLRLTSYVDVGDCGAMGDDFHSSWCKHNRTEDGYIANVTCEEQVVVPAWICGSGTANLSQVIGNFSKDDSVVSDGCEYEYFAQYDCDTDFVALDKEPILQGPWQEVRRIVWTSRHDWRDPNRIGGILQFWNSAVVFEWAIFFCALPLCIALHIYLIEWPSKIKYHFFALFVWLMVACLYNVVMFARLGSVQGAQWFTGYVMEFVFSIENVFVFHIVIKDFRTPRRQAQKAMFVVVVGQIIFQMIVFMGLANLIRSLKLLPYVLGVWLVYVGFQAALDSHSKMNIQETCIFKSFQLCLGDRLSLSYEDDRSFFIVREGGAKTHVSMLVPVVGCLLLVDFLFEIDVTLTKIETMDNAYIAFTSSVLAAFAVPELFFCARDLFKRFYLLKYGVCFVLIFFGVQMLMEDIFVIPELIGMAMVVVVMCVCMIISRMLSMGKWEDLEERERRAQADVDSEDTSSEHGDPHA